MRSWPHCFSLEKHSIISEEIIKGRENRGDFGRQERERGQNHRLWILEPIGKTGFCGAPDGGGYVKLCKFPQHCARFPVLQEGSNRQSTQ